jgi:hypothetical protein
MRRSGNPKQSNSEKTVLVRNWFQGLTPSILALHMIALGGMSGFAVYAVQDVNGSFLTRCLLTAFFSLLTLGCLVYGSLMTYESLQLYTIWVRVDEQLTVRWLSGIFCYGYDDIKSVIVAEQSYPWGWATARERTFTLGFADERVATVTLKGDTLDRLLNAFDEHDIEIDWQPE